MLTNTALAFQGVAVTTFQRAANVYPLIRNVMDARARGSPPPWAWRQHARQSMKAILAMDCFEDAHLFLGLLAEHGIYDNVCVNLLMSAYKKRNCLSQVMLLMSQMRGAGLQPDTVSFNIVVDACGKSNSIGLAIQFLEIMITEGVEPTVTTFTSIIDAASKNNDISLAESFLKRMIASGVQPNACTFTTMIQACCRAGSFTRALSLLMMLVNAELAAFDQQNGAVVAAVGDRTPYVTLLRESLIGGDVGTAFSTLELMISHPQDLRCENMLLSGLMDAALRTGRLDRTLKGFEAHEKWNVVPQSFHLNTFLEGCSCDGVFDGLDYCARALHLALDRAHAWPVSNKGLRAACSMVDAAVRDHRLDFAFLVLQAAAPRPEIIKDAVNDDTLLALAATCVGMGSITLAFDVLRLLHAINRPPPSAVFEVLLRACADECDMLLDELTAHGVLPEDEATCIVLLELCMQRDAFSAAGRMISHLEVIGVREVQTPQSRWALDRTLAATFRTASESVDDGEAAAAHALNARLRALSSTHLGNGIFLAGGVAPPAQVPPPVGTTCPGTPTECADQATTESPVSVTTSPTAAWDAAPLFGLLIDLPRSHAAWLAIQPPSVPPSPHLASPHGEHDLPPQVASTKASTTAPSTAPTKADELAELDLALARLAHEETAGPIGETAWWSEA